MTFFFLSPILIVTEPATPLVYYAQPGGTFILSEVPVMNPYPKRILTIPQQLQSYINAGMTISSIDEATVALTTIGYYRLRGYSFHLYDNASKQYLPGTDFSDVLNLYHFDTELSQLLFGMATCIEVALRARLSDALLTYNDALILTDPYVFSDKKLFWQNLSSLSSQVARSNDVFIRHNFHNHDGEIPLWAAVEIMSFGTLSKTIKNLKTGSTSAYTIFANYYRYRSPRGRLVKPSLQMLSSWIQSVSVLRNMCAHNSRIYNRTINTFPELLIADRLNPVPLHNGLYQILLAMKYLKPTDEIWKIFFADLQKLFAKYNGFFDLNCMNFPSDWITHFTL